MCSTRAWSSIPMFTRVALPQWRGGSPRPWMHCIIGWLPPKGMPGKQDAAAKKATAAAHRRSRGRGHSHSAVMHRRRTIGPTRMWPPRFARVASGPPSTSTAPAPARCLSFGPKPRRARMGGASLSGRTATGASMWGGDYLDRCRSTSCWRGGPSTHSHTKRCATCAGIGSAAPTSTRSTGPST